MSTFELRERAYMSVPLIPPTQKLWNSMQPRDCFLEVDSTPWLALKTPNYSKQNHLKWINRKPTWGQVFIWVGWEIRSYTIILSPLWRQYPDHTSMKMLSTKGKMFNKISLFILRTNMLECLIIGQMSVQVARMCSLLEACIGDKDTITQVSLC